MFTRLSKVGEAGLIGKAISDAKSLSISTSRSPDEWDDRGRNSDKPLGIQLLLSATVPTTMCRVLPSCPVLPPGGVLPRVNRDRRTTAR